jgi:cell division protein FtsB
MIDGDEESTGEESEENNEEKITYDTAYDFFLLMKYLTLPRSRSSWFYFCSALHLRSALLSERSLMIAVFAMRKRNYLKTDRVSTKTRNKRVFVVGGILLCLYFLASFIFGEMGVIKYFRMKARYNTLMQDISDLKQDNARLMKDVRALKGDPDRLEVVARDKLGLARKGEIVYYYDEP